eukprot:592594-Prorocentrum_minimum.AAC.2
MHSVSNMLTEGTCALVRVAGSFSRRETHVRAAEPIQYSYYSLLTFYLWTFSPLTTRDGIAIFVVLVELSIRPDCNRGALPCGLDSDAALHGRSDIVNC